MPRTSTQSSLSVYTRSRRLGLALLLLSLRLAVLLPDSWAVHLGPLVTGYESVEKGDFDAALTEFQKAIALAPNDTRAQYGVGYVYLQKGQPALAVPYFKKAFEVASEGDRTGKLNAAMSLAEAYALLKQADEAVRWVREARGWFEKMGWAEEVWKRRLGGPSFQSLREDPRYKALVEGRR